jgi:hypothetical protein
MSAAARFPNVRIGNMLAQWYEMLVAALLPPRPWLSSLPLPSFQFSVDKSS